MRKTLPIVFRIATAHVCRSLSAGFFLGASLIIAIGSQNAFVLRQGLCGEHVALDCLTCALSDALLIVAGVFGFGELVEHSPWVGPVARFGGVAFLVGYALLAFRSAWRGGGALEAAERAAPSWRWHWRPVWRLPG